MFNFGSIYEKCSNEIKHNGSGALKYYKMAINVGFVPSMNNYAHMLHEGIGIEPDFKEAIKYYKIGIENRSVEAMCNYASMLEDGEGVDANENEAMNYYKMSADRCSSIGLLSYLRLFKNKPNVDQRMAAEKLNDQCIIC